MIGPGPEKLLERSVHQSPLLSKRGVMERLFSFWFDSLVYNQIWEDPRVDQEALEIDEDSRILAIASGGCNILAYLTHSPKSVAAVDINQRHIYLTRLKLATLQYLPSYEDFFRFFGHADHPTNVANYHKFISPHLDKDTRDFWEGGKLSKLLRRQRINYFSKNFYDHAKLGLLLRMTHGLTKIVRKNPSKILEAETLEEQEKIFNETIAPFFDNRLVKAIGRNPFILFSLGIPPRQYASMKKEMKGDIIELFRERVKKLTCDFPVNDNYFAWQALSRGYDTDKKCAIPDYLKAENHKLLQENVTRATTTICSLTDYLRAQPEHSMNRFVFLDSQDWMLPWQIHELWAEVARTGMPGSRIIFRTGASESPIETALPAPLLKRFKYESARSKDLLKKDRSAIYGGFHLYVLRG